MPDLAREMFGPDAKFYLIHKEPIVCDDDEEWLVGPHGKVLSPVQERRWLWEVGTIEVTWEEFIEASEEYLARFKKTSEKSE